MKINLIALTIQRICNKGNLCANFKKMIYVWLNTSITTFKMIYAINLVWNTSFKQSRSIFIEISGLCIYEYHYQLSYFWVISLFRRQYQLWMIQTKWIILGYRCKIQCLKSVQLKLISVTQSKCVIVCDLIYSMKHNEWHI